MKIKSLLIIVITLILTIFLIHNLFILNQILFYEIKNLSKDVIKKFNIKLIKNYLLYSSRYDSTNITSKWLVNPYCLMKFNYDNNFNLSKIIDFSGFSSVGFTRITEYTYDSNENIIKSEKYDEFRYNENTKKEDKLYGSFPEITLYNYSYDTQQNIIQKIAQTDNIYETYIISENKITEKTITHTSNSMNTHFKYIYDKYNNLTEEIKYYPTCKLNKYHKHLYFESGQCTNECECHPNNSIDYTIIYKYDEYNNLVSIIKEDQNKKLLDQKLLTHNYFLKNTVIEYYDNKKLIKKEVIYYNHRNLITKKEIYFNNNNRPFEIQSFVYE